MTNETHASVWSFVHSAASRFQADPQADAKEVLHAASVPLASAGSVPASSSTKNESSIDKTSKNVAG